MQTTKKAICGICPAACWVETTLENGKLIKVEKDKDSLLGAICKLGENAPEIVYSEHRLKYPLKRKGKKGSMEFERISWDEAYEIIVSKLNHFKSEYGAESTAIYTGRGSFELALCDVYQPKDVAISSASSVLFPFGSPNTLGVGALCYVSFAMIAPHVTMGRMYHNMYSDIENAEMVVIWGANPATDTPPNSLYRILEAKERGADIVVIDPRRTAIAKMDGVKWLPIRPGTDGALALSICNILIREELYDTSFVEHYTQGFEHFSKYAQQFRPEVAESITGIPQQDIIDLAHALAEKNGVAPLMYTGLEYTNSGVQNIRAVFTAWALASQLDVPGGWCFAMEENQFKVNQEGLLPNPNMKRALGRERFPVYSAYRGESHAIALPDSVLKGIPYKIRALIIHGGSISTAWPQTSIWHKTLENLDFVVSIDRQLTADCAYADIVLPATTMFEIESYQTYGPIFRKREKVIEPVGEARNDFFIMAELAKRLGYGELYPQNEKELYEYVLKGTGFSPKDLEKNNGIIRKETKPMQYRKWEKGLLRADTQPGFDTPSGKFEIESGILEENGYDALPVFIAPTEGPENSPDLLDEYPLIFNSGARVKTDFRTQHHGIKSLYNERPEPTVTLNTKDAENRGIKNGDLVYVLTQRGQVKYRAFVTNDIVQGAIDANMGGGSPVGPKAWQEANVNELTDLQNFDPISGFPVYKALLCEVKKANLQTHALQLDSGEENIKEKYSKVQKKIKRIYFDNNATTKIHSKIKEKIPEWLELFGNPSTIYTEGKNNKRYIEAARKNLANLLNTTAARIIFTSGGSESNNFVLKGIAFKHLKDKGKIITTQIEHSSIMNTCRWLENKGFEIEYLPVNKNGQVALSNLEKAITKDTLLISIMTANNETGVIQNIKALAALAHRYDIPFHTDAVQAVGKIAIDVQDTQVDYLSLSGHKLHALKGSGAVYVRKGMELDAFIHGGGQERGYRGGTENTLALFSLGEAAKLAFVEAAKMKAVEQLRNYFESRLPEIFPDIIFNSQNVNRLSNTSSITFSDMRGESIVLEMDKKGFSFSSGSACRSGSPKPSHVLIAMGKSIDEAHCTIRISLSSESTKEEIELFLEALQQLSAQKDRIRYFACK